MVKKVTLKETVYSAVLSDISNGKYSPSDIITEGSLTEQFGFSKAPVREALIELCKDQILQSLPRFGYQLKPFNFREVNDLLDVRSDIETANLRRAFPLITKTHLDSLSDETLFKPAVELSKEISPNYFRNSQFHLRLCSFSGNPVAYSLLENLLKRCSVFFSSYYAYASRNNTESNSEYHRDVVNYLSAGDIDSACATLMKDIESFRSNLQMIVGI